MGIALAMGSSIEAAAAPLIGGGSWGGEVALGYEHERQETTTPDRADVDFRRDRYTERLGLRNNGFFLVDPGFFTGNLALTFDLFQEQDSTNGVESSRDGDLTGYAFDAALLTVKPYSAVLFANRNENLVTREFGGRAELSYENRGATFRLREDSFLRDLGIFYFSSTLGVRQEHARETTTVLDQRFARDEQRNVVTLEAAKGYETADLNLRFEATDSEDNLFPQRTFRSESGNLSYSRSFGPTLNRLWYTRLYYFERSGSAPVSFVTADQQVRLDHHQDFHTDYRYLYTRQETTGVTSTTQSGTFRAQRRYYKNLTTDYVLHGQHEELPGGERERRTGELDLNYRRTFAPARHVYARLGGRYQLDDNDLSANRVDVIDEPHTAPTPLGGLGFLLNNPFVVVSTIVVVDTRGGARLPTTLGVDYEIVQEGDFTRVIPLATSPVIQAGDPLAVSYTYEVAPSIEFSTSTWWIGGGADFQWIAFRVAHERADQRLRAGEDDRFLDDRRTNTAQLELRGDWRSFEARTALSYQTLDSSRLTYARRQLTQSLVHRPRRGWVVRLSADKSITDYDTPERQSETGSLRLTLDWSAPDGWLVTSFAATGRFEDDLVPTETFHEAGLRARRIYGKLELVPSLIWSDRERGAVETSDLRFDFKATRRF